jgi:glycosyltransferase involved in cell wall biosynthesis
VTPLTVAGARPARRRLAPTLVVVIPALDEEATIGFVAASVPREIPGVGRVEVVVVDDGSTDATRERAFDAGADNVISHPQRRGLVAAFKAGTQEALRRGAHIVVTLDADGQHDPRQIPELIDPLLRMEADIALGVRPLANAHDGMSTVRRYGNLAGSRIASAVLGVRITDATSGYRAFTRDALLRLNVVSRTTYTVETLIEAAGKNLTIAEVAVPVKPRLVGDSRMTHSVTRYIRRTGGQAAAAVIRANLVSIMLRLSFVAWAVAISTTVWFVWGYHADGAGRHLPSLLASVLSAVAAMGLMAASLLAAGIEGSRRLVEETLYHVRCLEIGAAEEAQAAETGEAPITLAG